MNPVIRGVEDKQTAHIHVLSAGDAFLLHSSRANPGDIPVEEPPKQQLHVNVRAGKDIGITIPVSLLMQADHVIR